MAAAKAFKAIDAPTRGVIVPYGQAGSGIITELCAAYLPDKEFVFLRRAQQFTVNIFPEVLGGDQGRCSARNPGGNRHTVPG